MKRKQVCALCLVLLCCVSGLFAQGAREDAFPPVLASTSWTAAFASLAGVEDITFLAPATLRHPPEYELTPSDIVRVRSAKVFIAAGYEKMMKTISDSLSTEGTVLVRITTENSLEKVKSETAKIAAATHTTPNLDGYIAELEKGKALVAASTKGKRVLCHKMQLPLAKDLSLEIAGTFGPGPVTASQIQDAKDGGYDFIIDNVHNPVAGPFAEVRDIPVVVWRNFPEKIGENMLEGVITENIKALESVL